MRKIRKVIIKNFQSHKETEINFDDYVIIHGATNSGKSAIIRAIKWCLYNEAPPEGAELTRFGEKETEVTICFNDGKIITRKRAGKVNEYILYDEAGVATNYTGFGRGPLKEVLDFHGMYQANLFGELQSINIVDQQEPPFFLSEGPTARGHLISRLAETLTYESALIMLKKDGGELKRGLDTKRLQIETLEKEIDELNYLEQLKDFLDESDKNSAILEANEQFIRNEPGLSICIQHDIDAYKYNITRAALIENIDVTQQVLQNIENNNNNLSAINRAKGVLSSTIEQWNSHHDTYSNLSDVEEQSNNVSVIDDNIVKLKQLGIAMVKHRSLVASYIALQQNALLESEILATQGETEVLTSNLSLLSQITEIGRKILQLSIEYSKLSDENTGIWKKIQEKTEEYKELLLSSGTCPTCFSKVDSANLIGVDI